jgi:hypothetical protein
MPEIREAAEVGHFVDDDIWPARDHGRTQRRFIEAVSDDRFGAHPPDGFGFPRRSSKPPDRMPCRQQCGNEPASNGAGGARNKDSHAPILTHLQPTGS